MKNKQLKNILLTSAAAIVVSLTPTHTVHAAGGVAVMAYDKPLVQHVMGAIYSFQESFNTLTGDCWNNEDYDWGRLTLRHIQILQHQWGDPLATLNKDGVIDKERLFGIADQTAHLGEFLVALATTGSPLLADEAKYRFSQISKLLFSSAEDVDIRQWKNSMGDLSDLFNKLTEESHRFPR